MSVRQQKGSSVGTFHQYLEELKRIAAKNAAVTAAQHGGPVWFNGTECRLEWTDDGRPILRQDPTIAKAA